MNYVREGGNETVTAPRPIPKPTPPMRPRFRLKDTSVILNPFVQTRLEALANVFYEKTGKELVITDGFRTPEAQARAMYLDASTGFLTRRYRQFAAAKQIQEAYNDAFERGLSRTGIEADMAQTIRSQVSRGIFISDHLRNNAADVRSTDMSAEEQSIFREIANRFAAKVNFEPRRGRRAEHWHLEF